MSSMTGTKGKVRKGKGTTVPRVRCFAPVAGRKARALILGSMPGEASLRAGRYYAHPRNSFWGIVCAALGREEAPPYPARLALLKDSGLALWDVLRSCVRRGSSDSEIKRAALAVNDFPAFFRRHPGITRVFFNGAKAEECYMKFVKPGLPESCARLKYRRLPSTSPAHAAVPLARKLAAWRSALAAVLRK